MQVAPAEQIIPKRGRTALQILGEEGFKEMGLPDDARHVDLQTAIQLATQKLIRDKYGIPEDATKTMVPEQMLNVVANLQMFDAEEHVTSETFWNNVSTGGLDVALGPVVSDKLGLPSGVRSGSPASKILDDAGQLQVFDMDLRNRGSWELLNDFQNGKLSPEQFAARADQLKDRGKGSGTGTVGGRNSGNAPGGGRSSNAPLGSGGPDADLGSPTLGGQKPAGNTGSRTDAAAQPNSPPAGGASASPPGSRGGSNSGRGSTTPGSGSASTPPPGSQNATTPAPGTSNSESGSGSGSSSRNGSATPGGTGGGFGGGQATGADDDGMTAEAYLGVGSYVKVTHNDDGSYTAEVVVVNANGDQESVQTETFSDPDGDGTYTGDKGGESTRRPKEGVYEGQETEEGTTFTYEAESSDDSASSDTDSSSDADVDTTDVDEYTPGRDGEYIMPLEQRLTYMQSLIQALNATKRTPGKGGSDSTPNPMNEDLGGGTVPYNPKDTVKRPLEGSSSNAGANVPLDALRQMQDPNKVQGGVIDPKKD